MSRYPLRKAAQGYRSPSQREGCRNCAHRSAQALSFDGGTSTAYDCRLGHFLVAPGGICDQYKPAGVVVRTPQGQPHEKL